MRAETLTHALGGRWHGNYGTARCPAHDDRNPSLSIKDGRDGRLLLHCFAGCEFDRIRSAIEERAYGGSALLAGNTTNIGRDVSHDRTVARLIERIWTSTIAIEGTLADQYLRSRGITGDLPTILRFHDNLRHPSGDLLPAMVARVVTIDGSRGGLHRTFLDPTVPRKTSRTPAKMMLGSCSGGAVRLRSGHLCLAVAEGIETALSVAMGLEDDVAIWSALSTSGMAGLILPNRESFSGLLLVATDGDRAGRTAGAALADRAVTRGWRVEVVSAPDGLDFNNLVAGAPNG